MKILPVLGPEAWVTDPRKKLDYLVAHCYASDASQTFLFPKKVSSMASVIKDNHGKLEQARQEIQQLLKDYFTTYFDIVEVSVFISETDDFHKGELILTARVGSSEGETVQLNEVLTNNGSLSRNFLKYMDTESNYG
jgi:hypothetical protein